MILVAGIIVCAVADELTIGEGSHHAELKYLGALIGGPAIYLFGNALFKRVVRGFLPQSHLFGLGFLAVLAVFASHLTVLVLGTLTTAIMLANKGVDKALGRI